MLREFEARQIPGDFQRRWFHGEHFDLYVWLREDGDFAGFQLCYDRLGDEHAFTWLADRGATHHRVDQPSAGMTFAPTPMLVPGREFPVARVAASFGEESGGIEAAIRELILRVISAPPAAR